MPFRSFGVYFTCVLSPLAIRRIPNLYATLLFIFDYPFALILEAKRFSQKLKSWIKYANNVSDSFLKNNKRMQSKVTFVIKRQRIHQNMQLISNAVFFIGNFLSSTLKKSNQVVFNLPLMYIIIMYDQRLSSE